MDTIGHPATYWAGAQGRARPAQALVPAADSGRFDLKVGSTTVRTRAGDGDYGSATVHVGTYTVSEVAASGTTLADYASSIDCRRRGISIRSGPGTSLGGIAVKVGDEIVCTIINERRGSIEIEKQTDPADSATTFGFTSGLAGSFSLKDDGVRTISRVATNQHTGDAAYSVLETPTAGWRLTSVGCGNDEDSSGSVATRTAAIRVSPGQTVHCTFHNTRIAASIAVVKDGPAQVHHGDTMTFTFAVTNTGNSPLHGVSVADDHCADVSDEPTERRNDDGDGLLEPGEVWVFSCSMPVPAGVSGEEDPIHNTPLPPA